MKPCTTSELPIARVMKVVNSHTVGLLLTQVMFWYAPGKTGKSKLRAFKLGHWWIAKSREDWMYETSLTLKEYKRVIRLLQEHRIIEVRQLPWGNRNVTHLRLVDQSFAQWYQGDHSKWTFGDHSGAVPKGPLCTTESTYRDNTQRGSGERTASSTENDLELRGRERSGEEREAAHLSRGEDADRPAPLLVRRLKSRQTVTRKPTGSLGGVMKAADILKAHTAPVEGSLGGYWKSRMKHFTNGTFQRNLTGKELGQLKLLKRSLGDLTKPVIAYATDHWMKFGGIAGARAGTSFPVAPDLGFLLKHHEVAANLLNPSAALSPPQEAPVQLIATGSEQEPVYEVSPQELTALLEGLKSPSKE